MVIFHSYVKLPEGTPWQHSKFEKALGTSRESPSDFHSSTRSGRAIGALCRVFCGLYLVVPYAHDHALPFRHIIHIYIYIYIIIHTHIHTHINK